MFSGFNAIFKINDIEEIKGKLDTLFLKLFYNENIIESEFDNMKKDISGYLKCILGIGVLGGKICKDIMNGESMVNLLSNLKKEFAVDYDKISFLGMFQKITELLQEELGDDEFSKLIQGIGSDYLVYKEDNNLSGSFYNMNEAYNGLLLGGNKYVIENEKKDTIDVDKIKKIVNDSNIEVGRKEVIVSIVDNIFDIPDYNFIKDVKLILESKFFKILLTGLESEASPTTASLSEVKNIFYIVIKPFFIEGNKKLSNIIEKIEVIEKNLKILIEFSSMVTKGLNVMRCKTLSESVGVELLGNDTIKSLMKEKGIDNVAKFNIEIEKMTNVGSIGKICSELKELREKREKREKKKRGEIIENLNVYFNKDIEEFIIGYDEKTKEKIKEKIIDIFNEKKYNVCDDIKLMGKSIIFKVLLEIVDEIIAESIFNNVFAVNGYNKFKMKGIAIK